MKRCFIFLMAISAICFSASCSKQEEINSQNELFDEMVKYSQHFADVFQTVDDYRTKGGELNDDCLYGQDIDISSLSDRFIEYIDLYTQPDCINDWDEQKVLDLVLKDDSLLDEEKIAFAHSISFTYYAKNIVPQYMILTRSSDDCHAQANKDLWRAFKRAAITLAVGLFEPTIAAETLAVVMFISDVEDVQEDLDDCLNG